MENNENLFLSVNVVWKRRKLLIVMTLIAFTGACAITLMLPNYYKATTSFYAASLDLVNPDKLFGQSANEMYYYGSDMDVDRLISNARSSELLTFLIDSFSLYSHYEIEESSINRRAKVRKKLTSLYDVKKNKLDAIELSIEDKNPVIASAMANAARYKLEQLARQMISSTQENLIETMTASIVNIEKELGIISDSLMYLRGKYGIYNRETQTEVLSTRITETESMLVRERTRYQVLKENNIPEDSLILIYAKVKGLENELKSLTSPNSTSNFNLSKFNEGLSKVEILEELYMREKSHISRDKMRLDQLKTASSSKASAIHIIDRAEVPQIKTRPRRSILVLAASAAVFLFCVFGILLVDSLKSLK